MNWFDQLCGAALLALVGCGGGAPLSTGTDAGTAEDLAQPAPPDLARPARDLSPATCNVATNAGCGAGSRCVLRGASETMFGCEPDVTGKTCDHCQTDGPNAIDGWDCNDAESVCGAYCRSDGDCHADEFCSPYGVNDYQFGTCVKACDLFTSCGCALPTNRCTIAPGDGYAQCQSEGTLFCENGAPINTSSDNVGGECTDYWDCLLNDVCLTIPPSTQGVCTAPCDAAHPCKDPTKHCMPVGLGGQTRITYQFCL